MEFLSDNQLAHYVTMRLGGPAKKIAIAKNEQNVVDIAKYAKSQKLPLITIGWGSNIIFDDHGYAGVVLINQIDGIEISKDGEVIAGAGELTDKVVEQTIAAGLVGLEALSGIPGTIGAAPINNVGAYGQEIKDTLTKIRAYDITQEQFVDITKTDCRFGYRDSIFKSQAKNRYVITKVWLKLKKISSDYQAPAYPSLQTELAKRQLTQPTLKDIRQTILGLRNSKLPNPKDLASAGSFYKNPVVEQSKVKALLAKYPDMPHYPQPNGNEKLSAAWLIEAAGLKNYRQNGFWVYDKQPLVLVNESSNSFKDLSSISDYIVGKIKDNFDVTLQTEPEIICYARTRC
jgi:UDP-N-acetylmuramate dehydrogenase